MRSHFPGIVLGGARFRSLHRCCLSVSGSRIASWLPSFSVEVMHTTNILGITQASNSQLNAMVRTAGCSEKRVSDGKEGRLDTHALKATWFVLTSLWQNGRIFRGILVIQQHHSDSCI